MVLIRNTCVVKVFRCVLLHSEINELNEFNLNQNSPDLICLMASFNKNLNVDKLLFRKKGLGTG